MGIPLHALAASLATPLALAVTLGAFPARAYRVFLDHDLDGDPATFENVVEGAASAPITIVIALDPEDADLDEVHFSIAWDCHEAGFFGVPHGDIEWSYPLPPSPPFSAPDMMACAGLGCGCVASRDFGSPVGTPRTPGHYRFATLSLSRGPEYDHVCFDVDCSLCAYRAGDDAATTMSFLTMIGTESMTWGRTKAGYR